MGLGCWLFMDSVWNVSLLQIPAHFRSHPTWWGAFVGVGNVVLRGYVWLHVRCICVGSAVCQQGFYTSLLIRPFHFVWGVNGRLLITRSFVIVICGMFNFFFSFYVFVCYVVCNKAFLLKLLVFDCVFRLLDLFSTYFVALVHAILDIDWLDFFQRLWRLVLSSFLGVVCGGW